MRFQRPSAAMVVAVIALVMSMTGGAIAAVNYARNAGAVDGKSAVKAGSSNDKAAGKLVATYAGGPDKGKIPFRNLAGVASKSAVDGAARGKNGVQLLAAPDNTATAAVDLIDLELGKLQVTCVDGQEKSGVVNPVTRITITNASGADINISRRAGVAPPSIQTLANGTVDTFDVGTQNTFSVQLHGGTKTVLVEGTAREARQNAAAGGCGVFATAVIVD